MVEFMLCMKLGRVSLVLFRLLFMCLCVLSICICSLVCVRVIVVVRLLGLVLIIMVLSREEGDMFCSIGVCLWLLFIV